MNPVAWFPQAVGVVVPTIHVYPTKTTPCLSLEATSAFKQLKLAWISLDWSYGPLLDVSLPLDLLSLCCSPLLHTVTLATV